MEKAAYSHNYPQMPPQMTSAGADQMPPAPPSYDQATGSNAPAGTYPPVQVLPSAQTHDNAQQQQQQQQQQQPPQSMPKAMPQPTYPTHRHNPPTGNMGGQTGFHAAQQTLPPHMMQQPVVIIQQQAILPLGPEPAYITCPACHMQKLTRIDYEPSSRTHLMAALLCILGFWCCVCLPYCAGSCMNTNHYCGNCNKFLGTYGNGL